MNLILMNAKVFSYGEDELARLRSVVPDLQIVQVSAAEVSDAQIARADVIFGWPNPKQLRAAVNLKWLHTPSAGIDPYADSGLYVNPNMIVTRSKDVFNIQIAEHIIMLFLALGRGLAPCVRSTDEGKWIRVSRQLELSGSTVLIVGAGAIGSELAKQLGGFGCRVIGIRRDPSAKPAHYDEMYAVSELDAQLPGADYVALCMPRTPDTVGMFDYRRLSLMKPSAILTNIGRGDALVSMDMDRALREGRIGGAGLDVTEPEPLPEGHPLWSAPNLIITSHTSGFSVNANRRRFDVFFDLWKRFAAGEPMHSTADFSKGY